MNLVDVDVRLIAAPFGPLKLLSVENEVNPSPPCPGAENESSIPGKPNPKPHGLKNGAVMVFCVGWE